MLWPPREPPTPPPSARAVTPLARRSRRRQGSRRRYLRASTRPSAPPAGSVVPRTPAPSRRLHGAIHGPLATVAPSLPHRGTPARLRPCRARSRSWPNPRPSPASWSPSPTGALRSPRESRPHGGLPSRPGSCCESRPAVPCAALRPRPSAPVRGDASLAADPSPGGDAPRGDGRGSAPARAAVAVSSSFG